MVGTAGRKSGACDGHGGEAKAVADQAAHWLGPFVALPVNGIGPAMVVMAGGPDAALISDRPPSPRNLNEAGFCQGQHGGLKSPFHVENCPDGLVV
jgi:hypothetical protein